METNLQESGGSHGTTGTPGGRGTTGEILLEFFSVLTKYRALIVRVVLVATVLAGGFAVFSQKWYLSSATVFPAEQTSMFPGLEGLSSVAKTLGVAGKLGSLGSGSDLDRYLAILKSESALMKVIDQFDLTKVYDITRYPREKTMKELLSNTEFEVTEEGGLRVSVYDTDPRRSADMANYFVQVLNETNSRMQAQNATENRVFIEGRVEEAKADLRKAENALQKQQEESGMIIMPEQSTSGVSAIAELYLMKAKKEVEIGILSRTVSQDNEMLRQLRVELQEIDKKVGQIPEIGMGTLRLYRDLVIQQKIMEFLIPLYEQAKVEEKRATPSVIVLDRAEVPERKAKPKISLYVLIAFVVSMVFVLMIVFMLEGVERLKRLQPGRFDGLVQAGRSDWFGLRFKRKDHHG